MKDAWYRIKDAHCRSTKKQVATVLLRIFYIGITSWYRFVLDTITGGNFLSASVSEAFNAIENLFGNPPIDDTKKITLEDIMKKLEAIESNMPSISKINDMDKKIDNNFNRVNGYIRNATKKVKTLHYPHDHPERLTKLEETFDTLGLTFSSLKSKKEETPIDKGPKFIFVPKNTTKVDTSFIGKEEVKMMEEDRISNGSKEDVPCGKVKAFDSQSFSINESIKSPLSSCTIHELDKNDDALDFEKT